MKIIISFGILFLFFQDTNFSQNNTNQLNSDSLVSKSKTLNQSMNNSQHKEFIYNYTEIMGSYSQVLQIDSLKYIYELQMLNKFLKSNFSLFNNSSKLLEHKQSLDLIILTGKKYYESQPNYDIGVVSNYLGISRKLFALILAIISL